MKQNYTSAKTSINTLNKVYKTLTVANKNHKTILDYGCGKYTRNRNHALGLGYKWLGYDPYNLDQKTNTETLNAVKKSKPNIIMCNNVLNVLEDEPMMNVLNEINSIADKDTEIYFTIFERDGNGVHCVSKDDCYQRNEKTDTYIPYINRFFKVIKKNGNIIKCSTRHDN